MIETIDSVVHLHGGTVPDTVADYGLLKVGSRAAINRYAELLSDVIVDEIEDSGWIVASPPYAALPSAANLLAAIVSEHLAGRLGESVKLLRLTKDSIGTAFFGTHYAGRSKIDRERYLDTDVDGWHRRQDIERAKILFINDVRITGAQERRQSKFFAQHGVAATHWQYLAALSGPGDAPLTEESLNVLGVESDIAFVELLGTNDWIPTTKSLWRVFSLGEEMFEHALSTIPPKVRQIVSTTLIAEHVPKLGRVARWISRNPPEPGHS